MAADLRTTIGRDGRHNMTSTLRKRKNCGAGQAGRQHTGDFMNDLLVNSHVDPFLLWDFLKGFEDCCLARASCVQRRSESFAHVCLVCFCLFDKLLLLQKCVLDFT